MYQLTETSFGRYRQLTLASPDGEQSLQIVPGQGAHLRSLRVGGYDWVEGCDTPEHLTANPWSRSSILFPFPNRLRDGRYEWLGKTYQFTTNDTQRDNALHGFTPTAVLPFTVVDQELEADRGGLLLRHEYAGERDSYPFPFRIDFRITLHAGGKLAAELRMHNTGTQPIPAGLGYHPYFRVGERIDDYKLQLPTVKMIGVDQRMIPNGKVYDYDKFSESGKVGVEVLDNCFRLEERSGRARVVVKGAYGKLEYWQAAGPDGFPYMQVFTHPDRTSLALEPMTCNIDAFNNHQGLTTLDPGANFGGRFGWQVEPIQNS